MKPIEPSASGSRPWYREPWPWLLMSMPALAVVGGLITLWLALSSNNALVIDDYYREGRAINLEIARDREATRLGLHAVLRQAPAGLQVELQSIAPAPALPATLQLRLVHATDAALDRTLVLRSLGGGHYVAGGERLPSTGRWSVHLADTQRRWRLVTPSGALVAPLELSGRKP